MVLGVGLKAHLIINMISAASRSSFLDIIETTGPGWYIVHEEFALVPNSLEFSAPKIIVQSRPKSCPNGTDYSDACGGVAISYLCTYFVWNDSF